MNNLFGVRHLDAALLPGSRTPHDEAQINKRRDHVLAAQSAFPPSYDFGEASKKSHSKLLQPAFYPGRSFTKTWLIP